MTKLIIGLDVGTSSVKAGLFNLDGRKMALARASYGIYSPHDGWAEQNPTEWWAAAKDALNTVMTGIDPARVAGLGLCGQCPGHVLLDEAGEAIGNAIIWRDRRATHEAQWLAENISGEQAAKWIGTFLGADAATPPARLLWLRDNLPGDWEQARLVLQPKDYIGLKLTGEAKTDIHSAYCLVNPATGKYEEDYFDLLGLPTEKMPPALALTAPLGAVSHRAAQQTGLPVGVPVIIGTIDAWCDNLAGGVTQAEVAVDVAGTSEMVSMHSTVDYPGGPVFLARLGDDFRFLCGPTQAGGDTLRWFSEGFLQNNNGQAAPPELGDGGQVSSPELGAGGHFQGKFDRLQSLADDVPAGSDGVIFLPYLYGERAPIWDPAARAGFLGLTGTHDLRHCVRAVYEGVGFAIRDILEICERINSHKAEYLIICGGGSQSRFWNQIKADIIQRPVKPTQVSESACLGAAILASVGVGIFPKLGAAGANMIRFKETIEPNKTNEAVYEDAFQRYLNIYPSLQPVFAGT
ncbi:MAG: FGGY family carbohydrate kinase [Chloroflexota bacterium]|nr:FGGY family carbohydrate kinase [Chloroflexota bacterium]